MNSLPKTVTRQRRGCDLNPGPSAPESGTLTTRLPCLGLTKGDVRCENWRRSSVEVGSTCDGRRAAAQIFSKSRACEMFHREISPPIFGEGGSVSERLACWTQAQKGPVRIAAATLSGNSLRQTVHTHRASVHQAANLVAALLRVAGVTAGLAESNGSLPSGL